ncbi:MAG: YfcE family phosphodiesterase, partial [Clostridium sp.]
MLDKIIESVGWIDKIIHLGDHYEDIIKINQKHNKDIIFVAGNNDWDKKDLSLREKTVQIGPINILITHGHRYGVNNSINNLFYKAEEVGAKIVLFGHTHIQFYHEEEGITFFNPGSISYPRDAGCGFG